MNAGRRVLVTGGSGFIGMNLMEALLREPGVALLNLDTREPQEPSHTPFWHSCDLLDGALVLREFEAFEPTEVVHLAGRTDMFGHTVEDYAANHTGTRRLLEAVKATHCVKRAIFTSSQFVVGPGLLPKDEFDFRPHTIYGESKVLSEKAVREADLACEWTIIRPTNIWGRWHPRYPKEFWKVVKRGRYVHPGGERVMRCYGYVGNVVEQILGILAAEASAVDGRVFYVGDAPINLLDWTNAFSIELTGNKVRVVPRAVLAALAKLGDVAKFFGVGLPIFSSRYRSMTETYLTPMEPTFAVLGQPRISLQEGVETTVRWLRELEASWR